MKVWTENIPAEAQNQLARDIDSVDFQYEYPEELNLHPKTDLHGWLVRQILERAHAARSMADQAHGEWAKLDQSLTAYVPADEADVLTRAQDPRRPVCVVVPKMLASLETYLTYLGGTFLDGVTHRYIGRGDKQTRIRAALLERVVAAQGNWFRESLHLRTMWRDALTYGVGLVAPCWSKARARRRVNSDVAEVADEVLRELAPDLDQKAFRRYMEDVTLMEGVELQNIDPYRALLDPNVSAYDIQRAEFVGYVRRTNVMQLLRQENDPEEFLFNCKYVRMLAERGAGHSTYWQDSSGRADRWETGAEYDYGTASAYTSAVDVVHMYIDLVPSDWGIGEEEYPVKWAFAVAGDSVLIQARPLDLDHGRFPVVACSPNSTGYDQLPVSHLATAYGMQQTVDFLVQSHVANIRKAVNNMLVVDPSRVHMEDVLNPMPGKIIRLKQTAYGTAGIDSYIRQLQVTDITRGHMADLGAFMDLMNRTLGTTDLMQGDMGSMPERPTAAGIGAAQTGGLSRLRELARTISVQSMQDLAWQNAFLTQQFMAQDVAVSLVGRYEQILRREYGAVMDGDDIWVTPGDVETAFEVEARKFGSETDNLSAISEVVKTALSVPGVAQTVFMEIDLSGLFLAWARKAGFEDVQEFIRAAPMGLQPQVMPDETIQEQAQAGNLVPLPAASPQAAPVGPMG